MIMYIDLSIIPISSLEGINEERFTFKKAGLPS